MTFLELCSVIVPELEGCFGNDTVATVNPFLETIRIHKGPDQARTRGTTAMFLATYSFF
jgi:hypothetical protein